MHAAARLIAGAMVRKQDAPYAHAGIEIRLDPGWHTYWRYPGDSGVPPTVDFSDSENVKSVTVRWPAPKKFTDDAGGQSIDYMGDLILPLRVAPVSAAYALSLHVKLNYAVCGDLCVPAAAKLELALSGDGAKEAALDEAERLVPERMALGVAARNGLAIRSARREAGSGGHARVVVALAAPVGAPVNLFVEGPTPDWALPLPEQDGPAAPVRRFTFDLDGLPPGAQAKNATLTFTAVSGGDAIEVPAQLD